MVEYRMISKEILDEIERMGYLVIKSKTISKSYYRLNDGSILEAIVDIESIVQDATQPNGYAIRTINHTLVYVPTQNRKPGGSLPTNPAELVAGIIDEDVQYQIINEDFSVYQLSNGLELSIKTIVSQVKKTKFYTREGEPVYSVTMTPVMKSKKLS